MTDKKLTVEDIAGDFSEVIERNRKEAVLEALDKVMDMGRKEAFATVCSHEQPLVVLELTDLAIIISKIKKEMEKKE